MLVEWKVYSYRNEVCCKKNKSSQNIKQGPYSSDWNVDFGDANEGQSSLWEDLFGNQENAIQTFVYIYIWIETDVHYVYI